MLTALRAALTPPALHGENQTSCWSPRLPYVAATPTKWGRPAPTFNFKERALDRLGRHQLLEIPCGKCPGCKRDQDRDWTKRLFAEGNTSQHNGKHNHFVTLTYSDTELPQGGGSFGTVHRPDVVEFLENVRRYLWYHHRESQLRYYFVGEYGGRTKRAHYHGLLFNVPLPDKKLAGNSNGLPLFSSETLDKLWGFKGRIRIGSVTPGSISYVRDYFGKYSSWPVTSARPFHMMSRGSGRSVLGGLGRAYYRKHRNTLFPAGVMRLGDVNESVGPQKIHTLPVPQYFLDLLQVDDPALYVETMTQRLKRIEETQSKLTPHNIAAKIRRLDQKMRREKHLADSIVSSDLGERRKELVDQLLRADASGEVLSFDQHMLESKAFTAFQVEDYLVELQRVGQLKDLGFIPKSRPYLLPGPDQSPDESWPGGRDPFPPGYESE